MTAFDAPRASVRDIVARVRAAQPAEGVNRHAYRTGNATERAGIERAATAAGKGVDEFIADRDQRRAVVDSKVAARHRTSEIAQNARR